MATSQFWQDLESQFRALEPGGHAWADWHYVAGNGGRGDWRLSGFPNHEAGLRFELLARRAGKVLTESDTDSGLSDWLDALKSRSRNFRCESHGVEQNEDGSRGACHVLGRVDRVCEAAANLCLSLQIEAEQTLLSNLLEHPNQQPAVNRTDGKGADRRAAVDAYIQEVFTATGRVITRTHIWKRAGDRSRAEFERWESHWYEKHGRKPNGAANGRFTRILAEKPHLK